MQEESINFQGKILAIIGVLIGVTIITGGVDLPVLFAFSIFAIYPFDYKIPKSWPLYLLYIGLLGYFAYSRFMFKIDNVPPINETVKSFAVGIILLPLFIKLYNVKGKNIEIAQKFLGFGFILALLILLSESIDGYHFYHLANPSQDPKEMERNLGRGAFVLIALLWPVIASKENELSKQIKLILVILTGVLSTRFDINLNIVMFVLSGLVYLLTSFAPKIILGIIGFETFILLAFAPQIYGFFAHLSKNLFTGKMPLSYERRADMWIYAIDKIKLKPFTGYGLDAAKTFNETVYLGGFPWAAIQNHPHSAPLNIWLEGGVIGIAFICCLVVFGTMQLIFNIKKNQTNTNALCAGLTVILMGWSISYGIWQQWLWILLFFIIAYSFLAHKHKSIDELVEI